MLKFRKYKEDRVYLSAKKHVGIEELVEMIRSHIYKEYTKCEMLIPYDQGQVVSYFNTHAHVLSTSYENEGTKLEVECKTVITKSISVLQFNKEGDPNMF